LQRDLDSAQLTLTTPPHERPAIQATSSASHATPVPAPLSPSFPAICRLLMLIQVMYLVFYIVALAKRFPPSFW
jgi:hypothetical protein